VVLIVLAIIGMLLPRNIRVERSVTIARPASLIYATVNRFNCSPNGRPGRIWIRTCAKPPKAARDGVGAELVCPAMTKWVPVRS